MVAMVVFMLSLEMARGMVLGVACSWAVSSNLIFDVEMSNIGFHLVCSDLVFSFNVKDENIIEVQTSIIRGYEAIEVDDRHIEKYFSYVDSEGYDRLKNYLNEKLHFFNEGYYN